MAGSIRLYGGSKAKMPALPARMPGWCIDTRELFMGTEEGNLLLASADSAAGIFDALTLREGQDLQGGQLGRTGGDIAFHDGTVLRPLACRAEGVAPLAEDADLTAVIAAFNGLVAALKNGKTMKE